MSADGQDLGQINMELFDEVNMSLTNKSEIREKLGKILDKVRHIAFII